MGNEEGILTSQLSNPSECHRQRRSLSKALLSVDSNHLSASSFQFQRRFQRKAGRLVVRFSNSAGYLLSCPGTVPLPKSTTLLGPDTFHFSSCIALRRPASEMCSFSFRQNLPQLYANPCSPKFLVHHWCLLYLPERLQLHECKSF